MVHFTIQDGVCRLCSRGFFKLSVNSDSSFELKEEQKIAVNHLPEGRDVFAVIPTGFGKSFIFELFSTAIELKKISEGLHLNSVILVICPLKSLIEDQIKEGQSLGLTCASLQDVNNLVDDNLPQLLFASAEKVLANDFKRILKDRSSKVHQQVELIVVDESHTVEIWTGKRNRQKEKSFRSAYGDLATLRSLCKEHVASLVNHLMQKLGTSAFNPPSSRKPEDCILGIYHSLSWDKYKERLPADFKVNGKKRLVVATTALSMRINFPDIRYIINWGAARNLLDHHQEAGGAGSDRCQSDVVVISCELCKEIVENCSKIFTVEDLMTSFSVFSTLHAVKILEVFQEIFNDSEHVLDTTNIPCYPEQVNNFFGYFDFSSDSDSDN
ncbi:uncharacterized protein [Montipora capricornis]|uniref:uncharacterized protein n=1 Tax=Montipora capricornis TaxID=246305 RepID=UPI0035F12C23